MTRDKRIALMTDLFSRTGLKDLEAERGVACPSRLNVHRRLRSGRRMRRSLTLMSTRVCTLVLNDDSTLLIYEVTDAPECDAWSLPLSSPDLISALRRVIERLRRKHLWRLRRLERS